MKYNTLKKALYGVLAGVLMTTSAVADDVKLQFRYNFANHEDMRNLLDDFEAENPGIKTELLRSSFGAARDLILRESAVGQGPDVVHSAFVWIQEMGESGSALPVDELAEKYLPFENGFDDYVANDLTYFDGHPYGVPWTADTWSMIVDMDILNEAGITEVPSTWDGLLEASRTIKEKTGKVGYIFAGSPPDGAFPVDYYMWSNGAALINDDGKGGFKIDVTVEQLTELFDYYTNYVSEGLVPKSIFTTGQIHGTEIQQGFAARDFAMAVMPISASRQIIADFADKNPGKPNPFITAVSPAGTGPASTHLGGTSLFVNSATKHPKEAWLLLRYLSSPGPMAKHFSKEMPATKTGLAKLSFPEAEQGFATQFQEHTRSWGAYSRGPVPIGVLRNLMGRGFASAISGQKSSEEAAKSLLDEVAKLME